MSLVIRPESKSDEDAIREVTRQAFASHPYSSHTEHFIVGALREANALAISLVAEQSGQVVGHIAFSPVTISDGSSGWFGLGPVSVLPSVQKRGIGRALIERGLSLLRECGAAGCVLLGEPSFYGRFGFVNTPRLILSGVPQEFFLALSFGSGSPQGEVTYQMNECERMERMGQIFTIDNFTSTLLISRERCLSLFSFSRNRFLPTLTVL